ncbi:MAG TPA: hypothetical protein VEK07_16735 [Polyangiaceae bacterium]|nr:hypothetical protein [Polyangiaceae bacterium]
MTQRLVGLESRFRLALRAVVPAPAGSRERVRARLAATLSALDTRPESAPEGEANDGHPAPSSPNAPPRGGLGSGALGAGKLAVLALVGGIAGAAVLHAVGARKSVQVVYVDRPAVPSPLAPTAPPAAPPSPIAGTWGESIATPNGPPETGLAGARSAETASASAHAHGAAASGASDLAAERVLLDEARTALVQGEPQRALGLLGRHRARFPGGVLAEERDAMRVEALVGAHRYGEARAAALAFRAHNRHSLFLATVDSAVESTP